MSKHALLSPSSASRWLACTPSALLESKMPRTTNAAADKGTLAHELGEILISQYFRGIGHPDFIDRPTKAKRLEEIQKKEKLYDEEMLKYCYHYRDFVIESYNVALAECPDTKIFLEVEVDLATYVPEGFGTSDVIIVSSKRIHIIDLKYGTGVPVAADNNKQMMVYGVGAIDQFEFIFSPEIIFMSIFQPRIDNSSTWDMQVSDLMEWAVDILKPKAFIASTGAGELVIGDHCRFCKVNGPCVAYSGKQMKMAQYDFREPAKENDPVDFALFLSSEEISDIVLKTKDFEKWLKAVNSYALTEAVTNGKTFPGLKLEQSSGKRMYKSAQEVEFKLLASQFKPDVIFKPKELYGITEMEKRLGTADFEEYLGDLIIKSRGSLSLVDEKSKKPAVDNLAKAREDFSPIEDDEEDFL